MKLFSNKAKKYFSDLSPIETTFDDVEIMNPYGCDETQALVKKFYTKFYHDNNERIFVFGINPGRFGGGLTGIAFTDPVALKEICGLENNLGERKELSSKFVYTVVDVLGGPKIFFSQVFLTALYPFALLKDGKNYNYYDEKRLAQKLKPEIVQTIKTQIQFGARRDKVVLLGKKNAEYFSVINEEHKFFKRVIVLEHPRYIMQYKLKKMDFYINKYIDAIGV